MGGVRSIWQDGAMPNMKEILSVTAERLRRWTTSCSAAETGCTDEDLALVK